MKKKLQISLFCVVSLCIIQSYKVQAQGLTASDYKKALWMTTRMYGGQRDGNGPNWLTMDHTPTDAEFTNMTSSKGAIKSQFVKGKDFTKDANGSTSLIGGWHDCADHVKFGQTQFYSAYTLLKGYAEFTAGYDDLYNGATYAGYQSSGDFSYEGGKGGPNGIPDILDELKYECDFIINCTPNATTFYSQVGDGDLDHKNWVTSPMMAILPKSEGGQNDGARTFVKSPVDASMSSFAAATLALMSRVYAKFDPAYAATCLTHAVYAYTYAKNNHGTVAAGSFYPANAHWEDDYACACAELYWATGTASYKTEALGLSSSIKDHNYCYNYNNNDDVAAYNLAKLGDATSKTLLTTLATRYIGTVSGGIYSGGDGTWGPLRYNANATFVVALYNKLNNITTGDVFIYNQLDYMLGKNSSNYSFVVGFTRSGCTGCTSSKQPHHRNVYLSDGNSTSGLTIPTHNAQFGYLVGGNRSASTSESITNYQTQEGGIDYNAGLVGALGYVNSKLASIDTNKFGHPTPTLGANQSMCGVTSIILDSKVATDGKKTFTWKKDGTTVVSASTSAKTYTATAAGVYICQIDSTGWSTTGTVTITATLPDFSIGNDVTLCTITSDTLIGAIGTGYTYTWKKDGTTISGATSNSYIAYSAGTYICTISATGCTSKSDTAIITSSLPKVINDTICTAGVASLSVTTSGTYAWYNVATNGTALATGATYSPSISASTIYYVQDASSVSGTVGPTALVSSSTSNWGVSSTLQMAFTVGATFTVNSIKMAINSVYSAGSGTVTVEILDGNGNAFSPAKTFTSNSVAITTAMAGTLVEFPFTNFTIDKSWGTSLRIRVSAIGFNGGLGFNESGASYPYNSSPSGIMTITGAYNGATASSAYYLYFYNWKISGGSTCGRTPVLAVINASGNCGPTATITAATSTTFCSGGSVVLNANTGTGYTYQWKKDGTNISNATSSTYTAITAGSYTVVVTANSVSTTSAATAVIVNALPTVNAGSDVAICSGKSTTLTASGGSSYSWSNNIATASNSVSPTATTTYTVTATNASGCSATDAVIVSVNIIPAIPTVTTPVSYVQNATATALTATGTDLLWYTVSTNGTGVSTAPIPTTTATGSTTYYVSQTINTCESSRASIVVNVISSIVTQTISLIAGWNLISFYVHPTDSSIATVFSTIGTNLVTIKNQDGFYDPSQLSIYNSLAKIEKGKAYMVNVKKAQTLTVTGNIVGSLAIRLKTGWNLVGYPKQSSGAITTILSGITTPLTFIKNFDGFYQKGGTTNSLSNMIPGSGYFINVSSACTLNY